MKINVVTIFYAIGLAHHLFIYYFSLYYIDITKTDKQVLKDIHRLAHRFVTTWNFGLQILYFILALILELAHQKKYPNLFNKLTNFRGYLFSICILPITLIILIFFWSLLYVNRDFILPEGYDEIWPTWINHSIHSLIVFLPIVELIFKNLYIPEVKVSVIIFSIICHIYNAIVVYTYYETGIWIYLFCKWLSFPEIIASLEFIYVSGVFLLICGIFFQRLKLNTTHKNQ